MPISVEELQKGTVPEGVREARIKPAVEAFLIAHPQEAFTVAELAELSIPGEQLNKQTVNQICRTLEEDGKAVRRQITVPDPKKPGNEKTLIYIGIVPPQ